MNHTIDAAAIPQELREAPNWVTWRLQQRDGDKPTKVPYCTDGRLAATNDEETWSRFDVALAAAGRFDGIGWTFSEDAGMVGTDLDNCLNADGTLKEWARPIVESLEGTYAEISPSGNGIKFWSRGRLPIEPDASGERKTGGNRKVDAAGNVLSSKDKANAAGAIEMYDSRRFFTVTTRRWNGAPAIVADKSDVTTALWHRIFAEPKPKEKFSPGLASTSPPTGRLDPLERCRKYLAKLPPAISGQGGHDQTFAAACYCYRFGLSDTEARQALDEYNQRCQPPWSDHELAHKLSDAKAKVIAAGEFGSMLNEDRRQAVAGHAVVGGSGEPAERTPPLTDLGNSERFATQHGDAVRYVHRVGSWMTWTRQRWERDESGEVMRLAAQTARAIHREAAAAASKAEAEAASRWALTSESRPRLEAMIELAKSRPGIALTPAELDRDAFKFNVVNGTLDLRTGELQPHERDDLITRLAPVTFDAAATCPRWLAFLERIFNSDAELIEFVQRWSGHSMTGDVSEQYLPVFHGVGANGKSVLVDTLKWIFADYAGEAPPDLLTMTHQRGHPTEIADLFGRRLVVASETEDGAELRIQLMKRLTGDAKLKGRFCHKDFFEFARTHKLILVTNNKPRVREQTEAVWRRLRLVPFNVVIPPSERDPHLLDALKAEAAGILNWLVAGCLDWQRHGLGEPAAVIDATNLYQSESDPLAAFATDCCEFHPDHWTPSADLRRAYEAWCEQGGERAIGGPRFRDTLKRYGCTPERRHEARGWRGIAVSSVTSVTPVTAAT